MQKGFSSSGISITIPGILQLTRRDHRRPGTPRIFGQNGHTMYTFEAQSMSARQLTSATMQLSMILTMPILTSGCIVTWSQRQLLPFCEDDKQSNATDIRDCFDFDNSGGERRHGDFNYVNFSPEHLLNPRRRLDIGSVSVGDDFPA